METTEIILPDIAKSCPLIKDLFSPENTDKQIQLYKAKLHNEDSPATYWHYKAKWEKQLAIFEDWKMHLDGLITLEEYNELHQLIDLA